MAATATLASKAVTVTPGGEAVTEVRVRNSGTVVDQFTIEVLGDASAWAIVEPAVVPLFPGAEAVARIKFKPPKSSSVPARAIPFAVRVKSREDARASLVEEGVVDDAWVAKKPKWERYRFHPVSFVMVWRKRA